MDFETNKFLMAVFTDIDGTFIGNDTFDPGKNLALVEEFDRHNHFFAFNSSKTFHEIASMQKNFKIKLTKKTELLNLKYGNKNY